VHNGSLQQNQSRLTYSYSTSAGDITGSTATLDSRGAQPGTITVTCNVGDDRNPPLTASASTTLNIESPPPPPDVTAIERRVALHRVYFATAKPTLESPDIGLLAIQEKTLRALAGGFQIYLQSKPEARLTLHLCFLFARLSFACPVMLCLCGLRGLKGAISGRNVMPTRLARKWF